jgi:hypothetical protein
MNEMVTLTAVTRVFLNDATAGFMRKHKAAMKLNAMLFISLI